MQGMPGNIHERPLTYQNGSTLPEMTDEAYLRFVHSRHPLAVALCCHTRRHICLPLVQEVAEGIYYIRLAKLALDEGHDIRQVGFPYIWAINDI